MGKIAATPLAKQLAKQKNIDLSRVHASGERTHILARDVLSASPSSIVNKKAMAHKCTPAAKRIAQQMGISLNDVSCAGSRIYKQDVLNTGKPSTAKAEVRPFPRIKLITAKRMLKSHLEIPPVTLNTRADITDMLVLRAKRNAEGGVKLSINDYVVYAVAQALKASPEAYASYSDDGLVMNPDINIGIATSLDKGLIVPVIKNADRLTIDEISIKIKDLAARARSGKLVPEEYSGGTFTISNLGMYGVVYFNPIINQPESMILGVCSVERELCMAERGVCMHDKIGLSLTFDHRVHDGAQAAAFLQTIRTQLESFKLEDK